MYMWLALSVPWEWILFLGKRQLFSILEMKFPETFSALSLLWILRRFLLAEVLLCSISCQERHGGRFCARTPGLPLGGPWASPGLLLPCLVGHPATPTLHSAVSSSHAVTSCVFVARAGTRALNLVGLHSFLLQCQPWLLGTSSGAGVFAGEALTPAVSFVSPAFLLNT